MCDDELDALVRQADALEAEARATQPTPEEERRIIDAAEALAGGDAGVPPKSRMAVAAVRCRAAEQLAVIINDNELPRAGRFEKKSAPRPWSPYAKIWRLRTPMLAPEGRRSIKISIRGAGRDVIAT